MGRRSGAGQDMGASELLGHTLAAASSGRQRTPKAPALEL